MKKNYLRKAVNAVLYPTPSFTDPIYCWEKFAEKAEYSRLENVLKQCPLARKSSERDVLYVILRRMMSGNWPKFSKKFILRNKSLIFRVNSLETVKEEVACNYNFDHPRYLIDKNSQMLGIVVNKNIIISNVVNYQASKLMAYRLGYRKLLPKNKEMAIVGTKLYEINRLLAKLNYQQIENNCWCEGETGMMIWEFPDKERKPQSNSVHETACFMFIV